MGVNSYAEIFTTLIGWHMYNVIWNVLAQTGIILLPFLGMVIENWRNAFIEGDEAGAAAGLRAMELDVYLGIFVLLLAGIPSGMTTLNRGDVFYAPPATTANPSPVTANGNAPGSTFGTTLGGTPAAVPIPLWWYSVMAISSGINSAIMAGAGLTLDDMRKITDASKRASLESPQLRYEALRFYNECYIPARTRFLKRPASPAAEAAMATYGVDDSEWIGSHAFRDDPHLYPSLYAEREVPGWPFDPLRDRDQAGAPIEPEWGRPSCKEWWEGGAVEGIRSKILNAVEKTSNLNTLVSNFGASLSEERRADLVAQTVLDKTRLTVIPDPQLPASSSHFVKDTFSSTTVMISGFITTFFTWLATAVLKPSLPFIQSLLLMGVYMLLPFVLVLSRYNLITMIQTGIVIFTIKFWSVLWFVTDFLDDKLALAIYPDADSAISAMSSFFRIGDPTKAMLLNLVVMSLYLALPALWSALMGMVGAKASLAVSSAVSDTIGPVKSAGQTAQTMAGKAASTAVRGVAQGARSINSRIGK